MGLEGKSGKATDWLLVKSQEIYPTLVAGKYQTTTKCNIHRGISALEFLPRVPVTVSHSKFLQVSTVHE